MGNHGEPEDWKGRLGDIRRGSCIAWINGILDEVGRPAIESRKELPWTFAVRFIRFLQGEHPDHRDFSQEQVDHALAQRIDSIHGWLTWNQDQVLAWEAKSRERRHS